MAFLVWSLVGVAAAYWGLQLFSHGPSTPAHALAAVEGHDERADLSRLLGVTPTAQAVETAAPSQNRLRLIGVVAPRSERAAAAGEGVALIEVDGVPRTVRVGSRIDGDLQLLRVDAKSASLGLAGRAPTQVLQLVPPAAPVTGALPPAEPSAVVLGGQPEARNAGGMPADAAPGANAPQGQMAVESPPAAAPSVYGAPPPPISNGLGTDNLPRRR